MTYTPPFISNSETISPSGRRRGRKMAPARDAGKRVNGARRVCKNDGSDHEGAARGL
jgi:hypothetical protein